MTTGDLVKIDTGERPMYGRIAAIHAGKKPTATVDLHDGGSGVYPLSQLSPTRVGTTVKVASVPAHFARIMHKHVGDTGRVSRDLGAWAQVSLGCHIGEHQLPWECLEVVP
jgi:hypothetical protein